MGRSWQSGGASTPVCTRSWWGYTSADWSASQKQHHPNNSQHKPTFKHLYCTGLLTSDPDSCSSSGSLWAIVTLFMLFYSCKVSIYAYIGHSLYFFLYYFICPAAAWWWPSHIKIELNYTFLVLQSAKHDLYLFSKLLPFSIMRDRSPSHRFLTHLLARARTGKPLALMMKMM